MGKIKRFCCTKMCCFEAYDDDGFLIDGGYRFVEPGSIWQEGGRLIEGGPGSVHLDREDGEPNMEWCELPKLALKEYFEEIDKEGN